MINIHDLSFLTKKNKKHLFTHWKTHTLDTHLTGEPMRTSSCSHPLQGAAGRAPPENSSTAWASAKLAHVMAASTIA